jgi:hypothetical protein
VCMYGTVDSYFKHAVGSAKSSTYVRGYSIKSESPLGKGTILQEVAMASSYHRCREYGAQSADRMHLSCSMHTCAANSARNCRGPGLKNTEQDCSGNRAIQHGNLDHATILVGNSFAIGQR